MTKNSKPPVTPISASVKRPYTPMTAASPEERMAEWRREQAEKKYREQIDFCNLYLEDVT